MNLKLNSQQNGTPSPYLQFSRESWKEFRRSTPLPLSLAEVEALQSQNEPISLSEVEEIYLPLSRLLNLYVQATQDLYQVTTRFLGHPEPRVPYMIGIAGSVAVGKSTVSRLLKALLSRWPNHPRVELVTTDGYLYPTRILEQKGILQRKGFPESYDLKALLQFLSDLKAGQPQLRVPIYSHYHYDPLPGEFQKIEQPDIVIVEGLNVLQTTRPGSSNPLHLAVSDFFDFTLYVDAPTPLIQKWYLERFLRFWENAKKEPQAYFHKFAQLTEKEAIQFATQVWKQVNEVNLNENILPYRNRARLILEKGENHSIQRVFLRKL